MENNSKSNIDDFLEGIYKRGISKAEEKLHPFGNKSSDFDNMDNYEDDKIDNEVSNVSKESKRHIRQLSGDLVNDILSKNFKKNNEDNIIVKEKKIASSTNINKDADIYNKNDNQNVYEKKDIDINIINDVIKEDTNEHILTSHCNLKKEEIEKEDNEMKLITNSNDDKDNKDIEENEDNSKLFTNQSKQASHTNKNHNNTNNPLFLINQELEEQRNREKNYDQEELQHIKEISGGFIYELLSNNYNDNIKSFENTRMLKERVNSGKEEIIENNENKDDIEDQDIANNKDLEENNKDKNEDSKEKQENTNENNNKEDLLKLESLPLDDKKEHNDTHNLNLNSKNRNSSNQNMNYSHQHQKTETEVADNSLDFIQTKYHNALNRDFNDDDNNVYQIENSGENSFYNNRKNSVNHEHSKKRDSKSVHPIDISKEISNNNDNDVKESDNEYINDENDENENIFKKSKENKENNEIEKSEILDIHNYEKEGSEEIKNNNENNDINDNNYNNSIREIKEREKDNEEKEDSKNLISQSIINSKDDDIKDSSENNKNDKDKNINQIPYIEKPSNMNIAEVIKPEEKVSDINNVQKVSSNKFGRMNTIKKLEHSIAEPEIKDNRKQTNLSNVDTKKESSTNSLITDPTNKGINKQKTLFKKLTVYDRSDERVKESKKIYKNQITILKNEGNDNSNILYDQIEEESIRKMVSRSIDESENTEKQYKNKFSNDLNWGSSNNSPHKNNIRISQDQISHNDVIKEEDKEREERMNSKERKVEKNISDVVMTENENIIDNFNSTYNTNSMITPDNKNGHINVNLNTHSSKHTNINTNNDKNRGLKISNLEQKREKSNKKIINNNITDKNKNNNRYNDTNTNNINTKDITDQKQKSKQKLPSLKIIPKQKLPGKQQEIESSNNINNNIINHNNNKNTLQPIKQIKNAKFSNNTNTSTSINKSHSKQKSVLSSNSNFNKGIIYINANNKSRIKSKNSTIKNSKSFGSGIIKDNNTSGNESPLKSNNNENNIDTEKDIIIPSFKQKINYNKNERYSGKIRFHQAPYNPNNTNSNINNSSSNRSNNKLANSNYTINTFNTDRKANKNHNWNNFSQGFGNYSSSNNYNKNKINSINVNQASVKSFDYEIDNNLTTGKPKNYSTSGYLKQIFNMPKSNSKIRQQNISKLLRDPTNPYSTAWTDKQLNSKFDCKIEFKKFINGYPIFILVKNNRKSPFSKYTTSINKSQGKGVKMPHINNTKSTTSFGRSNIKNTSHGKNEINQSQSININTENNEIEYPYIISQINNEE